MRILIVSYSSDAYLGLKLYWVQLVLNLAWTPIFFLLRQKGLALVDMVVLVGTVYWMTVSISLVVDSVSELFQITLNAPTDGRSTILLTPYCLWLTFATYLNSSLWYQNRAPLVNKKE